MANKKTEEAQLAQELAQEDEYTVEDFAAVARPIFGTSPDIVIAAFVTAGVKRATKSEAMEIIKQFREKEVN